MSLSLCEARSVSGVRTRPLGQVCKPCIGDWTCDCSGQETQIHCFTPLPHHHLPHHLPLPTTHLAPQKPILHQPQHTAKPKKLVQLHKLKSGPSFIVTPCHHDAVGAPQPRCLTLLLALLPSLFLFLFFFFLFLCFVASS